MPLYPYPPNGETDREPGDERARSAPHPESMDPDQRGRLGCVITGIIVLAVIMLTTTWHAFFPN